MLLRALATVRNHSRLSFTRCSWFSFHNRQFCELRIPLEKASKANTHFPTRSHFHTGAGVAFDSGNDTIYAVSTAPGRAGIAVVRASGPACLNVSLPPTIPEHTDRYRYTKPSALINRLPSLDMHRCEHSTIH